MKKLAIVALALAGSLSLLSSEASAIVCAKGAYGAKCVGPRGAFIAHRYHGPHYYGRSGAMVRHFSGPYRSRTVIRRY